MFEMMTVLPDVLTCIASQGLSPPVMGVPAQVHPLDWMMSFSVFGLLSLHSVPGVVGRFGLKSLQSSSWQMPSLSLSVQFAQKR